MKIDIEKKPSQVKKWLGKFFGSPLGRIVTKMGPDMLKKSSENSVALPERCVHIAMPVTVVVANSIAFTSSVAALQSSPSLLLRLPLSS